MSLLNPNWFHRLIVWIRTPKHKSPAQLVSDPRPKVDPAPDKPAEAHFDPDATLLMNGGRKNGDIPKE